MSLYRHGIALIIFGLAASFLWESIVEFASGHYLAFLTPAYWGYFLYLWYRVNRSVYHVEFDDEFLYVKLKASDLIIPLENIKDVNLVSLGGVYRVDLYCKELIGDKFYFKPSLLYPLNHKKKEAVVDILWKNINQAKQKRTFVPRNALHS
ncbi:MAG: hypothetical protein ACK5V5_02000 [Cyclobacteriaceae bacterium]|nr:hypothetical protein [Flammeovirgaceae bacterium]